MILKPIFPTNGTQLRLANGEDELLYEIPEGMDGGVFQLDTATSWTAASVVTAQGSLSKAKFYGFGIAATYTAVGIQLPLTITGLRYIRLYVSAAVAGSDVVVPIFNVWKNNA